MIRTLVIAMLVTLLTTDMSAQAAMLGSDINVKVVVVDWNPSTPNQQTVREIGARPGNLRDIFAQGMSMSGPALSQDYLQELSKSGVLPAGVIVNTSQTPSCQFELRPAGMPVVEFSDHSLPKIRAIYPGNRIICPILILGFGGASPTSTGSLGLTYDLVLTAETMIGPSVGTIGPLLVRLVSLDALNIRLETSPLTPLHPQLINSLPDVITNTLRQSPTLRANLTSNNNAALGGLNNMLRPMGQTPPLTYWYNKNTLEFAFAPPNWPGRINPLPAATGKDWDPAWFILPTAAPAGVGKAPPPAPTP